MKLEVKELKKNFGSKEVLKGINLCAESGIALGLLGRNGAGKTTTIRIIMNVFAPDSGQVILDGNPMKRSEVRIGYLPEERGLYPKRTIKDQLIYFGRLKGLSTTQADESAKKWIARFGMEEHYLKLLDTLSKGNQQKIQLATTMLGDPDIVILDEPFSGLDPINAQEFKNVVREVVDNGKLVLFSSHQMNQVEEFCDEIALLNDGAIVLSGNLHKIKRGYDRTKLLIVLESGVYGEDSLKVLQTVFDRVKAEGKAKSMEDTRDGVIFHLTSESAKQAVMHHIAETGIQIDKFIIMEPSLEEIFIEKVGSAE